MNQLLNNKYKQVRELANESNHRIILGSFWENENEIQVAIKEVDLAKQDIYFQQELLTIKQLMKQEQEGNTCENIIKIYDTFTVDGKFYIVSKYYQDGDLNSFIHKYHGQYDCHTVIEISLQILNGIQYLHKIGITNCNLKSENILLHYSSGNLQVVLTDFSFTSIQNLKSTVGSINHLAPEILLMKSYEKYVDIWSFGCLLYEIIYNHQFFIGDNNQEVALAIKQFKEYNYQITKQKERPLDALIKDCLVVDPKRRLLIEQLIKRLQKSDKILSDQFQKERIKEMQRNQDIKEILEEKKQVRQYHLFYSVNKQSKQQEQAQYGDRKSNNQIEMLVTKYLKSNILKSQDIDDLSKTNKTSLVTANQINNYQFSQMNLSCNIQTVIVLLYHILQKTIYQQDSVYNQIDKTILDQKMKSQLYFVMLYCTLNESHSTKIYYFFNFLKNNHFQQIVKELSTHQLKLYEDQFQFVNERVLAYQKQKNYMLTKMLIENVKLNIINFIRFIFLILSSSGIRKNYTERYLYPFVHKSEKRAHKIINPVVLIFKYLCLVIATISISLILLIICLSFETVFFLIKLIIFDFQVLRYVIELIRHILIRKIDNIRITIIR